MSPPSRSWRALMVGAAAGAGIALAGCQTDGRLPLRAMQPLSPKMLAEIESRDMAKESPILLRIFKEEAELELWKQDRSGRFALLKSYPICRWSGELGPKIREGDRQAPEGFYDITPAQMNPNSNYYLSFNLGYPNAFDRAHGRTGSLLMVHGDCSSRGCYSMTDEQIGEIYALAREAFFGGQTAFQVQAYPFRMTPINMARHRNNPHMPFWKMLKEGYDHFEVTQLQPKVDVCEKRYVFNAEAPEGATAPLNFSPTRRCPAYEVSPDIVAAVAEKRRRDEIETAALIRRGTPTAPIRTGRDGGMHPVFLAKLKPQELRTADGDVRIVETSAPGTIPDTVNPPRDPEPAAAGTFVVAAAPLPRAAPLPKPDAPDARPAASGRAPGGVLGLVASDSAPRTASASSGGLFDSLFSSRSERPRGERENALARVGAAVSRWFGGGDEGRTTNARAQPARIPAPKPAPAARPAPQPVTAAAPPLRPPQALPPAASALAAPPPAGGLMPGAQPVVRADSFESRWAGWGTAK